MAYGQLNFNSTPITSTLSIGQSDSGISLVGTGSYARPSMFNTAAFGQAFSDMGASISRTGSAISSALQPSQAFSDWLSSPQGTLSGISGGAQALSTVMSSIGAYNTAKHNYTATVNNAQELIDQTERQVQDLKKQWYLQDSANQTFIAKSGLRAESFIDAQRDNLLETEGTIVDMRAYARKQAQVMINEARRAKKKAKKGKIGALLGTAIGTVGGALIGGPAGAGVGAGIGSSLFSSGMQL